MTCTAPGCQHEELDLTRLLRHASLYSADSVYETAELAGMEALDLGALARGLSEVVRQGEPRQKLDRDQQRRLANRLLLLGVAEDEVRYFTGLSRSALESLTNPPQSPRKAAPRRRRRDNGSTRPNVRTCGNDACGAVLDAKRMDARFCNATCRQAAHRKATA